VWLALSPVGPANGSMRMIPGSHLLGQLAHEKTYDSSSILRRGQRVTGAVDETNAVEIVLAIGQASFHHTVTLHGSGANRTDAWRLGVGFNYVGGDVGPVAGHLDSALLLRGSAERSGFMLETPPRADLDAQALEHYDEIVQRSGSRYRDVKSKDRGHA
jgi:non-heme Fe2+,alpha-ketoglutarate-dependent halogenase